MKFSPLSLYKTIEFDGGIAIIAANDNLQRPDAVPLIVANGPTTVEYLRRYFAAREDGKTIVEANGAALEGASVIEQGALLVAGKS